MKQLFTSFRMVTLIGIFMVCANTVKGQNCQLPENWQTLPFMQDVGHCPTCMSNEVWLDNVTRLYCLRVDQQKLATLEEKNAAQAATIDSLEAAINRLQNELQAKAVPAPQPQQPATNNNYISIDIDIEQTVPAPILPDTPQVEEIVDTIIPHLWFFQGGGGWQSGFFSQSFPNPRKPQFPFGFNDQEDGPALTLGLGRRPNLEKWFNIAGHASAAWMLYTLPHAEANTSAPQLWDGQLGLLFTPRWKKESRAGVILGPEFGWSRYSPVKTNWTRLSARVGLYWAKDANHSFMISTSVLSLNRARIDAASAEPINRAVEVTFNSGHLRIFGRYALQSAKRNKKKWRRWNRQ